MRDATIYFLSRIVARLSSTRSNIFLLKANVTLKCSKLEILEQGIYHSATKRSPQKDEGFYSIVLLLLL